MNNTFQIGVTICIKTLRTETTAIIFVRCCISSCENTTDGVLPLQDSGKELNRHLHLVLVALFGTPVVS